MRFYSVYVLVVMIVSACTGGSQKHYIPRDSTAGDSAIIHRTADVEATDERSTQKEVSAWNYTDSLDAQYINTGRTKAEDLVAYAETLTGTPYFYGSVDPQKGFDCSGFITYVFNHFNIAVPRSSEGFTSVEREVSLKDAKRGDIILFTGTDSTRRVVGHMGIITSAQNGHQFIHSTSGKAYGVTKTPLNPYYQGRFVKVIRIFNN